MNMNQWFLWFWRDGSGQWAPGEWVVPQYDRRTGSWTSLTYDILRLNGPQDSGWWFAQAVDGRTRNGRFERNQIGSFSGQWERGPVTEGYTYR